MRRRARYVRCSQPEGKTVDELVPFRLVSLSVAEAEQKERIEKWIDERSRSGM